MVVAPLGYDVILGKPWLTKVNPNIDWQTNEIKFNNGKTWHCIGEAPTMDTVVSVMEFASMIKKEKVEVCAAFVTFDFKRQESEEWTHSDPVIREIIQLSDRFPKVLPKGDPTTRLGIDHKIRLTGDGKVPVLPIIRLSPPELEELKKQLAFLLEQGWVQPSQSLYEAPVLFARKNDGRL